MKKDLSLLVTAAAQQWLVSAGYSADVLDTVQIERTRDLAHGDFSTTVAMALAKPCRLAPRRIAENILQHLPNNDLIARIEVAEAGYLNFFITPYRMQQTVQTIIEQGEKYGHHPRRGQRVLIEFVSSNPTGPLHVGHGRGAAYGAALAAILVAAGFDVEREYYVNDAGRQMKILTVSIWLRYLELCGDSFTFPQNGYRGDYIIPIAAALKQRVGKALYRPITTVYQNLPPDFDETTQTGDKDEYIDALIHRVENLLNASEFELIREHGLTAILDDIKTDLAEFGVHFERWFSEMDLLHSDAVKNTLAALSEKNYLYEKEGALWFRASDFGDEKDRVVMRSNGVYTYFATDLAYHVHKFARGYDHIIDIFGADHHGYQARIGAVIAALGYDVQRFHVLLVQFAILYRSGKKVSMSTRSGSFVTLRELRQEVGNDAARFFYVLRKSEQHMDFDLDLAIAHSNENPVYYIQYAHARICSVLRQLREKDMTYDSHTALQHLHLLIETEERHLLHKLSAYPDIIEQSARQFEPHLLANYLRELANELHIYYNTHQFLKISTPLRDARIALIIAVRHVLANGLELVGVSAPESM